MVEIITGPKTDIILYGNFMYWSKNDFLNLFYTLFLLLDLYTGTLSPFSKNEKILFIHKFF